MALTTNRIKTTNRSKMLIGAREGSVGTTAGFVTNNDNGTVTVPNAVTAGTYVIPISGISIGDTITCLRLRGATAGAAAKTIAWGLWKTISASGTITATLIQAMTTDTTATAHAIDIETYLTTAYKTLTKEQYFVLLTVTTNGAATTVDITGVEIDIKRTFGQES